MSATSEPRLPFDPVADTIAPDLSDGSARAAAVDPTRNVVLEASAGTGKTRVLVERYVNLLRAGVEPDHILAITFTRKAAAEMRQRIIDRLKEASRLSEFDAARWRDLRDRLGDVAILTIDAFCLSLVREFPLEADVDPAFELADDTEVPRLVDESLDAALRTCRGIAREDEDVALVFAQLGERRLRTGIAALLDRRLVAPEVLRRFLASGPKEITSTVAVERAAARLREVFGSVRGSVEAFLSDGPIRHPAFHMLAADVLALARNEGSIVSPAAFRNLIDRLRTYFVTQDGSPRTERFAGSGFTAADCDTEEAWKRHRQNAAAIAPAVVEAIRGFRRDLNVVLARGVCRIFAVALAEYRRTLDAHAVVDFSGVLERAVRLLKDLDEFSETRLRLESRHRHVLVDEFQDTSRAQWELVRQLVKSWGEGFGVSADAIAPSIFIVGDRKQSIYGFRDADVSLADEAGAFIEGLRPGSQPRRAITVSFRAVPAILSFVNDLFGEIARDGSATRRRDAFRYGDEDRFPVRAGAATASGANLTGDDAVRIIVGETVRQAALRVAREVVTLLSRGTVRDRTTGIRRPARPADIAILFRSRDSHREFEAALERSGVATYVYKGLGFFDTDEVQDVVALIRYLADPTSDLRAAALVRSRVVRLSDIGVARLAPRLADAILAPECPPAVAGFDDEDRRVFALLRSAAPRWLADVDRQTPSALLTAVLRETAYAFELRGPRRQQARENLKKLGGMVRRAQNRGYGTMERIAAHLERLAVGDESNAVIDAVDAVSLMTVHAAKGLEFPIVFVVNIGRGTGGVRQMIRVSDTAGEAAVAIADYQSEADEDVQAREREETKRLLYVALTRACDRLYLSATVKDGQCRMGRGSLGEVLPDRVKAMFVAAARDTMSDAAGVAETRRLAQSPNIKEVVDDFEPFT